MSVMDRRRWLVSAGGAALLMACKDIVHKDTDTGGTSGGTGATRATGATGATGASSATTLSNGVCTSADWNCLMNTFDDGANKQIGFAGINNMLKASDMHPYVEAAYKPRFDFVTDANNQNPPIIDWALLGLHAETLGEICAVVFVWEKKDPKRFFLTPDPNRPFGQAHFDLARDMLGYYLNPHITDRGPHFKNENGPQSSSINGRESDSACPLCP
jgi:hypothetical protein